MAVADDDYRKRLADRLMRGTEATSNRIVEGLKAAARIGEESFYPTYQATGPNPLAFLGSPTFRKTGIGQSLARTGFGQRLMESQGRLGGAMGGYEGPVSTVGKAFTDPSAGTAVMAGLTLGEFHPGGRGSRAASRLVDQIPTPVLQRAIQAAAMEGKQLGGKWVEEGASQGVKFGQSGVARAGRAGEDALFEIIDDFERMGADARTLTRYLKGFAKYADDPFEAMESMGENMMRETKGFKEALIDRTYRRIGDAAERAFF